MNCEKNTIFPENPVQTKILFIICYLVDVKRLNTDISIITAECAKMIVEQQHVPCDAMKPCTL